MKMFYNRLSNTKTFRFALATGFSIAFVLWLPLVLLVLPFYLGWEFSGYMLEKKYMKENNTKDLLDSKWGSFHVDFNSWKNKMESE